MLSDSRSRGTARISSEDVRRTCAVRLQETRDGLPVSPDPGRILPLVDWVSKLMDFANRANALPAVREMRRALAQALGINDPTGGDPI